MTTYRRVAPGMLLVFLFVNCLIVPAAHATQMPMISTGQVLAEQSRAHDHAVIVGALTREDAAAALSRFGVSADQIEGRLDRLTDADLAKLAQQADELPAGDGAVGALVFIFLVLLVLELLGAINIFPGIRSAN